MLTYRNRLSDVLLPFVQPVPFPIGYITHISLCIPSRLPVYVTSIVSKPGQFVLSVATQKQDITSQQYSCVFIYDKNLQIKSTHQNGIQGVLTLAHLPDQTFSYTGKWQIHQKYIKAVRALSNYTNIRVNGSTYQLQGVLDILFKGYIQVSGTDVARTQGLSFGVPSTLASGVNAVNNMSVQKLYIKSADQAITVAATPIVSGDVVVLYINTTEQFPACQ